MINMLLGGRFAEIAERYRWSSPAQMESAGADAVRYHSIYGTYGISVFAVRDATVDELEDGVRRLVSCPHQVVPNVYHDA
jgi:hypothetical protein